MGSLFVSWGVAWIVAAWVTFTAALSAMTLMCVRFMFPNVLAEPPSTIKVGLPTNYEPEEVSERFKAEWGFWIVRSTRYDGQDIIYAFSRSARTWAARPTGWPPSRNSSARATAAAFTSRESISRGPPPPPRAIQGRARRRRPDHGRQEPEIPARVGAMVGPR